MRHAIEAIYENGLFRPIQHEVIPIAEGQRVRITVEDEGDPQALRLAMAVYEGLSDNDIHEIEAVALDRGSFFRPGSGE
jgi:predicted DNA-binding antitoxin AbrB/MazE fold protein